MLAFSFKISIEKNCIKYFTVFEDFPFLLEDPKNKTLRLRLQRSFERLVTEQEINKRWCLNEQRLFSLIHDLNLIMKDSGAMWVNIHEESGYKEFVLQKEKKIRLINVPSIYTRVFVQVPQQSFHSSAPRPRTQLNSTNNQQVNAIKIRILSETPKSRQAESTKTKKLFRPWQ